MQFSIQHMLKALAASLFIAFIASPTMASDGLVLNKVWIRATPPGASAGGGYLTITNHGSKDETLLGGGAPGVGKVEIHTMEMDGDVMRMKPVEGGLVIPAGETVTLKPGGYHVMFIGLDAPLVEGKMLKGTLTFDHAGDIPTTFHIGPVGAKDMHGHGHGHDHGHKHGHAHKGS